MLELEDFTATEFNKIFSGKSHVSCGQKTSVSKTISASIIRVIMIWPVDRGYFIDSEML